MSQSLVPTLKVSSHTGPLEAARPRGLKEPSWPHMDTIRSFISEEALTRHRFYQDLYLELLATKSCENTCLLFVSHWFYGSLGTVVKTEGQKETT